MSVIDRLRAAARSVRKEIRVFREVARDPRTPLLARVLLGLAVGYVLMPIDLIPDFIPVVGHLDDLVIVPVLVIVALWLIPDNVLEDHRSRTKLAEGRAT